jgi:hypothetical protein
LANKDRQPLSKPKKSLPKPKKSVPKADDHQEPAKGQPDPGKGQPDPGKGKPDPMPADQPPSKSLTIPRTHPRLWWSKDRLALAKKWYAKNPFTPKNNDPLANALRYVLTGEGASAQAAIKVLMSFSIPDERLRQVSVDYYRWAGWVPVVYDWTFNALTPDQRKSFMAHYNHYVDVIRQKPWGGVGMEGNNYYWGYLRNELNWAIATYHENPKAKTFLTHALETRWKKSFLPWAAGPGRGGVPPEGWQYGRYLLAYPLVPFISSRLLGRDLYNETNFFREATFHLIYATTPAPTFPKGGTKAYYQVFAFADDETYDGFPGAISFEYGDFMTTAANQWADTPAGRYARHWLRTVRPAISGYVAAVDRGGKARSVGDLPLDYYAPGIRYLYTRNRWGPKATTAFLQLGKGANASHLHLDFGSFQIWRNGRWLSRESTGYSMAFAGGGSADTIAHNGILFNGRGLAPDYPDGPPKTLRLQSTPTYSYAVVDLSAAYRAHRSSHRDRDDNPYALKAVREFLFLRPLETMLILDRLEADGKKVPAKDVVRTFLLHLPARPKFQGTNRLLAVNGDQALRVTTLLPKSHQRRVVDEGDFKGKHLAPSYYQYRLEVSQKGEPQSYFLHVLQARKAKGRDLKVKLREDTTSWTIRLDHPTRGQAVVVFQKGMGSNGGSLAFAKRQAPSKPFPLLDRVQGFTVTKMGPRWDKP